MSKLVGRDQSYAGRVQGIDTDRRSPYSKRHMDRVEISLAPAIRQLHAR